MKKLKYVKLFESFRSLKDDKNEILKDKLKDAKNLDEINSIITDFQLTKGELIKIAFNNNIDDVDTALPQSIWDLLKPYGGTFWFVMDYQNNGLGKIVHLGEKIIGKETDWEDILNKK